MDAGHSSDRSELINKDVNNTNTMALNESTLAVVCLEITEWVSFVRLQVDLSVSLVHFGTFGDDII